MSAMKTERWLGTALLVGVVYVLVGLLFTALSGSATSRAWFFTWRLGAWVVSAVVYAAHIGHEHGRSRRVRAGAGRDRARAGGATSEPLALRSCTGALAGHHRAPCVRGGFGWMRDAEPVAATRIGQGRYWTTR